MGSHEVVSIMNCSMGLTVTDSFIPFHRACAFMMLSYNHAKLICVGLAIARTIEDEPDA
jgi:hypothetical protein